MVVQAFAFHQGPLGSLDQAPGVKRDLELLSQGTFELGLGGGPEQAGHHPGIGLQGADLALVPASRVGRVHVQGADWAAAQLHRHTQPRADLDLDKVKAISPQRRSMVASRMTAGLPVVNASAQGPAANTSWFSSRVWARRSEALAHRSRPSMSASMTPAASASNSCLAAMTAWCRVAAGRAWGAGRSGCRCSWPAWPGRSAWQLPLGPVAELANPVNRPGTNDGPGCRSGPAAPRSRVGFHRVPDGNRPGQHSRSRAAGHLGGSPAGCQARLLVAAPAAHLSRQAWYRLPERVDRDPVRLRQLAGAALPPGHFR